MPPAAVPECHVVPQRTGKQERVLREISDEPSPVPSRETRERTSIDENDARFDGVEPQNGARERALAGADGPGDADERSGRDVEVEFFERRAFAARVSEGHIAQRYSDRPRSLARGSGRVARNPGDMSGSKRSQARLAGNR